MLETILHVLHFIITRVRYWHGLIIKLSYIIIYIYHAANYDGTYIGSCKPMAFLMIHTNMDLVDNTFYWVCFLLYFDDA